MRNLNKTNKEQTMENKHQPTDKMVINALLDKITSLEHSLLKSETKVMFQEEEIVKLKQENANLKHELKEVA
ncbi:MAG: hypothetical protein Unbinned4234contig1003_36 [Prokaryotic dsDNA virus sp.]|nr:MAG: hypothetical protein Unbinned4234contig1003_36 [Prokaryotic dsDNA virus sp.]|tara:strand:+ start:11244 stop:11459 length:216 start_codon:yes stop_codon:yes gene_type:complete